MNVISIILRGFGWPAQNTNFLRIYKSKRTTEINVALFQIGVS